MTAACGSPSSSCLKLFLLFLIAAPHTLVLLSAEAAPSDPSSSSSIADHAIQITQQLSDTVKRLRDQISSSSSSSTPSKPSLVDTASASVHNHQSSASPGPPPPLYDYIVVGAGAAGSPAARTLAEAGHSVLLIERGRLRSRATTPNAMDIYGAGVAIIDSDISQLLITKQGVRSHIGTVMGGGTAINMAIMIEETNEFFNFLQQTYPQNQWNMDRVRESYDWVSSRVASPMPSTHPYGTAWKGGLFDIGFEPNKGFNSTTGHPEIEPSLKMQVGNYWQGMSLFNASDSFYRNAADRLLGSAATDPTPPTLTVLSEHAVQKVIFEDDGGEPRAVCVEYRPTEHDDVKTINSRKVTLMGVAVPDWASWLQGLFDPFLSLQSLFQRIRPVKIEPLLRACVKKPHGEIILSAGAVLTPSLLFKSGVGPVDQIETLGLDLVKEFPNLGRNISDRVLIPIGMFREGDPPPQGFPTRICQAIGAKLDGPGCTDYKIGDPNLRCSLTTMEELGGSHIGENVIYSTRYIFPPEHRNEPLIEYIFNVITACADGRYPYNSVLMGSACVLAQPVVDCFRRVVANFYFSAEPKSRGKIELTKDGDLVVDPKYMDNEQDLFDAVRGVSNIIRVVNSDVYRGVIQPASKHSCPVTILNGFLDLILQIGANSRPMLNDDSGKFEQIQKHLEDLIPSGHRTHLREGEANKSTEATAEDSSTTPSSSTEESLSFSLPSFFSAVPPQPLSTPDNFLADYLSGLPKAPSDVTPRESLPLSSSAGFSSPFLPPPISASNVYSSPVTKSPFADKDLKELFRNFDKPDQLEGAEWKKPSEWTIKKSPKQWVASYPPTLPDPDEPADVAKYVLSYMTSIWHFTGSAAIGDVVNTDFSVKGIKGLGIIDASVLNQVTRMNPTATLMMLGRYAALSRLDQRTA
eukprot:GHVS01073525.1.p1 GENE.GHVS01073525.1~~GHVS01073525.1.p1  ORF type:complete len:919 (-),score=149.88 GHVS01073525.1:2065-4821(-)